MSGEAVGWAFRKVQMDDPTAKFVLVAICNYANDVDQAWPSHASIAALTGLSKRTIQNSIDKLEAWGLIRRERRDRGNGSETSAMVHIDLNTSWVVKGGVASAAIGVWNPLPQGVAPDSTLETKTKPQSKKDVGYSEEFEALWSAYPRTKNTSKKAAWDIYRMLNAENQARVKAAVPIFAAAMRAEGRTEDKIKHMQFWLSSRMYETASAPAGASANGAPANDAPFWKRATREQWGRVLDRWRETERWSASWGPDPDQSTCKVPADMLAAHNLKYRRSLFRQADLERFERMIGSRPASPPLAM